MQSIHITDIEAAINYWRQISPSPDGVELCAPVRALASVYALMIHYHEDSVSTEGFPAKAYAAWLSKQTGQTYRLPSEVEWEYAARAGTSTARFFSEGDSDERSLVSLACDYANVYDASAARDLAFPIPYARCSDGHTYTAPVASYRPNAFDLYDLLGNVREWTEDCYTASNEGRPDDARAWVWAGGCEQRVVRGGSYASRPSHARAAAREAELEGLRQADLGFRLVREMN